MIRVSLVAIACAVSLVSWGQTQARPQTQVGGTAAVSNPSGGNQGQPSGTVRNDRNATMPRVGVSANPNAASELVGCIAKTGNVYVLHQPMLNRTYQLRGNDGALSENSGRMVRVTGRLTFGTPAGFNVQQVQVIQPKCNYAQTQFVRPVTGETGPEGSAFNTTSTASVGQTTPGYQTEAGEKQNPSMAEGVSNFGAYPGQPPQRTESQGAPPDPRFENPAEAERIANSATRSELQNGRQLGINAQPNYSEESNAQQTEQLTASEAQQMRGQATDSTRVLQGGGAEITTAKGTQEQGSLATAPVFSGCIEQQANQLVLVDSSTGLHYKIEAGGTNLGQFLNQQVRVVGNITGTYGPAVGTAQNSATVYVDTIRAIGACKAH